MSANRDALEGLRSEVTQTESVIDSAILLITGLVNRLAAALTGDDLAGDITTLRDELDSAQVKLATAVAENTAGADDSDGTTPDTNPIGEQPDESTQNDGDTSTDSTTTGAGDEPQLIDDENVEADEADGTEVAESEDDAAEVSGDTTALPTGDDVVNANNSDDTESSNENGNTTA